MIAHERAMGMMAEKDRLEAQAKMKVKKNG